MAITIKRVKDERGVPLGSLKVGDTFMYDNRIGVIASRNGHDFPLEFSTCCEMVMHDSYPFVKTLPPDTVVLPVEVEVGYKVVG